MEYLSATDQRSLAARYKFTRTLVTLFAVAVVVYMLVGRMVSLGAARQVSAEMYEGLRYAAVTGTGGAVLLAMLLRRVLLARGQLEMAARKGVAAVLGRLSLVSIICAALGEVTGILGLVSSLLTGDSSFSLRLGLAGLLLIAYGFPRRWEWQRQAAAAARATSGDQSQPRERILT
jgi:hypothetical protein